MVYHAREMSIVREVTGFFDNDLVNVIFDSRGCSCRHCGLRGIGQHRADDRRRRTLYYRDVQT